MAVPITFPPISHFAINWVVHYLPANSLHSPSTAVFSMSKGDRQTDRQTKAYWNKILDLQWRNKHTELKCILTSIYTMFAGGTSCCNTKHNWEQEVISTNKDFHWTTRFFCASWIWKCIHQLSPFLHQFAKSLIIKLKMNSISLQLAKKSHLVSVWLKLTLLHDP